MEANEPDADAWLTRDPLPEDPLPRLVTWLDEAWQARLERNPHAMTLATVDPDGAPSARIVLCNGIDAENGGVRFYTNRDSRKGRALAATPRAALVFHWGPQERQARVEGTVSAVPEPEADAYFASRPREARLGAWASDQSQPIASRAALESRLAEIRERFGEAAGEPLPRPPHWGGYELRALRIELWRSRPARLHDRAAWTRSAPDAPWSVERLQP